MNKSKKHNFFPIIITLIILFFSIIIFLSIPVLYNYKSIEREIEKKFYSKFNINLKILDEINYHFIPRPHLLVKKANLNLNIESKNSSNIETENLKIFISPKNLYSKSNLEFEKVEIVDTNFKFKLQDIKNFRNYLYDKKNNSILVKKSKLFYLDKNNNTILICPISKLIYSINEKENYKKLKIDGSIFDINYASVWKSYDETPKNSNTEVKFRNPNVFLKNLFEFKSISQFSGLSSLNFLNETITIKYNFNNQKIKIESPNLNERVKIKSDIELNPFFFETDVTFSEYKLNFLIDYILNLIIDSNPEFLGNLNGNLIFNLNKIENDFINRGQILININEKLAEVKKSYFKIDGGTIKSKISYMDDKGDLIFLSENILNINNKKKFAKKLQINARKINHVDKIYFNLQKNIDTGKISISEIKLNDIKNQNLLKQNYHINNVQELRSLLKSILYT